MIQMIKCSYSFISIRITYFTTQLLLITDFIHIAVKYVTLTLMYYIYNTALRLVILLSLSLSSCSFIFFFSIFTLISLFFILYDCVHLHCLVGRFPLEFP